MYQHQIIIRLRVHGSNYYCILFPDTIPIICYLSSGERKHTHTHTHALFFLKNFFLLNQYDNRTATSYIILCISDRKTYKMLRDSFSIIIIFFFDFFIFHPTATLCSTRWLTVKLSRVGT